jgi:hypothetical protein
VEIKPFKTTVLETTLNKDSNKLDFVFEAAEPRENEGKVERIWGLQ